MILTTYEIKLLYAMYLDAPTIYELEGVCPDAYKRLQAMQTAGLCSCDDPTALMLMDDEPICWSLTEKGDALVVWADDMRGAWDADDFELDTDTFEWSRP